MKFLIQDVRSGQYVRIEQGGQMSVFTFVKEPAEATVFSDRSYEGVLFHKYEMALHLSCSHGFEKIPVADPKQPKLRKRVSLHFRSGNIVAIDCDEFKLSFSAGNLHILFDNTLTKVDYINFKEVVLVTHQEVDA